MSAWVMIWAYCLGMPPMACHVEQDIKGKHYSTEKECKQASEKYAAKPFCHEIKLK